MNPRVLVLSLAAALLPTNAGAAKVFLNPTNSTAAVGSGTRASYALEVSNKASARLQGASVQTQVQAGPISPTAGSSAAVDAANTWNADKFVTVASNAFNGTAHGTETYCWKNPETGVVSAGGQTLATKVQEGLLGSYTLPDRGTKTNSTWDVLKRTTMPAAVTYVVFDDCVTAHTSLPGGASERAFLSSASGHQTIGTGLANGVCASLGVSCDPGPVCTPSPEVCDGRDNDCDNEVDENNPGGGVSCNTGQPGVCAAGTTRCRNGELECNPNATPTTEICNGKDDNCNGQVDENNPGGGGSCNTGNPGVCNQGEKRCVGGNIVCMEVNQASPEICDGKDNDCDGSIDEDVQSGGDCNTGLPGVCAAGEARCEGGTFTCVQKVQASPEICDGKDNDCNGQVDDSPACQSPDAGEPDAGEQDAGLADSGQGQDAGLPIVDSDAGVEQDAGKPRGQVPEVPNAGCGCTSGVDGSALLGLFALAGLLRRRRA